MNSDKLKQFRLYSLTENILHFRIMLLTVCKLFLNFVILIFVISSTAAFECPKTDQCTCQTKNENFEFNCSPEEITIISKSKLLIDCKQNNLVNVFLKMPNLNLEPDFGLLRIKNCFLPNESIRFALTEKFGIQEYNSFYFYNENTWVEKTNSAVQMERKHFRGFENSKELIIYDVFQTSFPPDLLHDLQNLSSLLIVANIEEIPIRFFKNLIKLGSLWLCTALKIMPDFSQLRLLNILRIEHIWDEDIAFEQNIKTFSSSAFANLVKLERIWCEAQLTLLPEDVFKGSYNLLEISFESNLLNNLPRSLLFDQKKLEIISFEKNEISSLHREFLKYQARLKHLSLSHNILTSIPK